jgi:NitT/TauT family transport system substrate-binding protein
LRIGHLALMVVSILAACAASGSTRSPTASTDAQRAPSSAPLGAAATSSIGGAEAEPPLLARLHVPHSSVSATHAPIWVAIEKGYFRQRGLDIETSYIAGGATIAAALVSGQASMIISGAAGPLLAAAQGADFVFLGTSGETLPFRLLAQPGLQSRDDLRGKSIAVAGRGSTLEAGALLMLQEWGWERNREVRLVNVGSTPDVYQALLTGATEAAMVADPYASDAMRQGYNALADLLELATPYATSCLITTRAYLERERSIVRAFLEGFVEGTARTLADTPTALEVVNKYIPVDDPAVAAAGWERTRREIRAVPRVSVRGLETVRRLAAEDNPQLAAFDPARVADDSLFDELEQSGSIDAILRKHGLSR